jgi:hypothetical protein
MIGMGMGCYNPMGNSPLTSLLAGLVPDAKARVDGYDGCPDAGHRIRSFSFPVGLSSLPSNGVRGSAERRSTLYLEDMYTH